MIQRHRPFKEGARIYNLFPLLAGAMDRWPAHMERAKSMGFNAIFVNPFHLPGFSGSLYSIKDYYRINPVLVSKTSSKAPLDQLRDVVATAHDMGLQMIMDLVINHTAVDSPLIRKHPDWYLRNPDGSVVNPSVWEGDKLVTVWGDLAEIDNEHSRDRERLWDYWEELALFYREVGFGGFRCDAAYQVTDALWRELIGRVKGQYPDTTFYAETLGCVIEDVVKLAQAGFDYTFNSSKYWDFEEDWCLRQYRENSPWAPSVSFAESHDTERLFKELQGDVQGIKQRYLFSALFSTGVMMPMGFEFGFSRKPHVVETRPSDWEKVHADMTGFITAVNTIKKNGAVFNEDGPIDQIDCGNPKVLCLLKSTLEGNGQAMIILNKDRQESQKLRIADLPALFAGSGPLLDKSPESPESPAPNDYRITIEPSGYRVLCQAA
jgi:starch synthase (maltosyl-transferring)